MKKLKMTVVLAALFFTTASVQAQDYKTGIGLRLGGYTSGISVKSFLGSVNAIEGIAGFGYHSFVVTGLYEHHIPIKGAAGLSFYPGAGIHMGFFAYNGTYRVYKNRGEHIYVVDEGTSAVVPGIDGVLGLEYKFNNAPLSLGLDIHPFIDVYSGASMYVDGALSFRYVF
ncbi:MAG TPA: hypothetical protein VFW78_03500 [Bacteroidia bacterium]|nr:hypothetical protein [Bacteroidia bacterium]